MDTQELGTSFQKTFGRRHNWTIQAPGRVNLIGEHTDYNDGFVFPAAIDRHVTILASARSDREVHAFSTDFSQKTSFALENISRDSTATWSNYIRGVILQLEKHGYEVPGMDLLVAGNVPIGSGLSSSAALEVATAETCRVLGDLEIEKVQMALVCQAAEREFVGVNCGIMDQFVSALAEERTALFLDCRDLSYSLIPLDVPARIVVCDTRVQRRLDGSAYNQRRSECEEAVRILSGHFPGIRALRDAAMGQLARCSDELTPTIRRRARHVISENDRVLEAVDLLKKGRIPEFGRLLYQSHESLRDDYEVSCKELDTMVQLAAEHEGTLGARMTGAGFGGCTVNLVRTEAIEDFCAHMKVGYERETGLTPNVYVCKPSRGASSWRSPQ